MADVGPDEKKSKPRNQSRGSAAYAKTQAIAAWMVEQRKADPMIRHSELEKLAIDKFFGGKRDTRTQEKVRRGLRIGSDAIRDAFNAFAADVPQILLDGYLALHNEHTTRAASCSRERDRAQHLREARQNLDSIRDMFGMGDSININVFGSGGIDPASFSPLSDDQLEALATMDVVAELGIGDGQIIDVPDEDAVSDLEAIDTEEDLQNGHGNGNGSNSNGSNGNGHR